MLQKLHITNYAIITDVDIDFSKGFNIITGETGAGKSILLGALSLILGDRADVSTLLDASKKCIVEGTFSLSENNKLLKAMLSELDIEEDIEILIRREIAPNGKSRAFVNDTPVTITQVKQIASLLVDLHQQFDTLELSEQGFQREIVDCIAHTNTDVEQYQKTYKEYSKAKKEIALLLEQQLQANKTLDYNKFLFDELEEANLKPNELETLEEELKVLNNAENIKATLSQVSDGLKNNESPIVQQLKQLANALRTITAMHNEIESLHVRLNSVVLELDDIANEIENVEQHIVLDAERIEIINDKINTGYKLLKKHSVQTTEQLIAIKADLEQQIIAVVNTEVDMQRKEKAAKDLLEKVNVLANEIHDKRVAVAEPLSKKINALLYKIGMPNATLKIVVEKTTLNEYGTSQIEFLFDANKSNKFEPIRKVASGGELSRLMLCIKSLVAGVMQLPVLIFDEIDTGISGEAARQVGIIMEGLAKEHQIICITHQAQIAAKANTHYFVYKAIENNAVTTGIKVLSNDERITTLAQMLSGEKPTAAALQNAREMMGN